MKILGLLEKELVIKDSSDLYCIILLKIHVFSQTVTIFVGCFYSNKGYMRDLRKISIMMITGDVSETIVHFKML